MSIARVLIVAGSDSGGGAGIQADIKTVTMLGGHAMTAITAITVQNTLGVSDVLAIPAETVVAQIDAVAGDIGVDAIKIGMIGSAATAEAVAERLEAMPGVPVVFDPVMVATSGSALADKATIAAFERLMAVATVVTPNLPELAALGGEEAVCASGAAVLIKDGHGAGEIVEDRLVSDGGVFSWRHLRLETSSTHGTGCSLASAVAAGLAQGMKLEAACERAIAYVQAALTAAPGLGGGHGPIGHTLGRRPFDELVS